MFVESKIFYKKENIFSCLVVSCKIHMKKYFQCLVLHVKHFPKICQKPYLIQANLSKNKLIVTKNKLLLLPQPYHVNKIKTHYMNPIKSQILREKNGGRWVGGGGLVRMRDGLMEVGRRSTLRMRDGSAENEDEGCVSEDEGWVGRVPAPCSA
ncbi:hypothetical protein SO802_030078 [Lithocarpus litseifolius]|uniref:Uncharacterized protein n=1 Tax=Lithocarpus litseifolius TaxID=425828 RepID=A0AAW2BYH1_9ROSI